MAESLWQNPFKIERTPGRLYEMRLISEMKKLLSRKYFENKIVTTLLNFGKKYLKIFS